MDNKREGIVEVMKKEKIVAQMYTVCSYLKTPQDIAKSLKKVKSIGYEAVQLSGLGPIDTVELRKMMDGEGLICAATHEDMDMILDEPDKVVEKLNQLGCIYTAIPSPGNIDLCNEAAVAAWISRINDAGKVFTEKGKVLTYHNHHIEFRRLAGRLILDMIYDGTNPLYLQGEIDTFWVQAGGGDSIAWCEKLKGRIPLLHLKDYGVDSENNRIFEEIGAGNLDIPGIITAAERGGCEWFIVEQDSNWVNNDPFESLKISFDYLAGLCG